MSTNPLAEYIPPEPFIDGNYRFETLSVGKYSSIIKVEDVNNVRSKYCIKAEYDRASKTNYLHQEINVLTKLATREHVPRLYYCERGDSFSFMVITLHGNSIWVLRRQIPSMMLSAPCAARIAIHVLYQLKQLHDIGFILRDLKVGDMVLGLHGADAKVVYLIDYGMCRNFVMKDKQGNLVVRPQRDKVMVRGILRYCSLRIHQRKEVCRADDLMSLMYIIIDLVVGLPWRGLKEEGPVAEEKEKTSDEVLLRRCPEEWVKIHKHIRSLKYESRPDYKLIFQSFRETLIRNKVSYADPWDWEEETDGVKEKKEKIEHAEPEQSTSSTEQTDESESGPLPPEPKSTQSTVNTPLDKIITAVHKCASRGILRAPVFREIPKERIIASDYDAAFPTTNPAVFEKNDLGI